LGTTTRGVNVIRDDNGLVVSATDGGLRPPPPSSVEPSGIPARPTDDAEPIPPPDEADAGPAKELLPVKPQAPDAVPVIPPPSNGDVGVDVPAPEDVPGIEPPTPEHVVMLPVGDAPDVIGLTPGDASSVAPKGRLVGATGEPGPMPSGDVMPRGEAPGEMLIPPICAKAEPQPKRTAAVIAIIKRVIVGPRPKCRLSRPRSAAARC
jgi:hypothetical protein